MAKHAAEVIAFHFGCDIADVRDAAYQPTRYTSPRVYVISTNAGDYWCAPSGKQKPPRGWRWQKVATYYGRDVFVGNASDE